MRELDPRQQTILRAIVVEYVLTAEPVGSGALLEKYPLGVKSATVRNEMAEMSDLGYLEQPHTSAGRIPSDLGYRYYVDRLILKRELEQSTKQRVRDTTDEGDALQGLLRDTASVLSRLTHLLSVATTVRDADVTVRNAVVSALGPARALLVLILSNGHVENRMVDCPPGLTLDDVGLANEQLSAAITGRTLRQITRTKAPAGLGNLAIDRLLSTLWTSLRSMARDLTRGHTVVEGEEFLFGQPEFQRDVGSLSELLEQLTESDVLYEAVGPGAGPRTVTIGRENRDERLRQLSVVRHSFYVGENEAGVIALVGPTRMRYEVSIPLVNFTANALSESLTRYYG
ncbi:MAG TPA: heat-inducible transcriptional repressor HrcA [Fimbriimonas sp.]